MSKRTNFAFYCKTYGGDFESFCRLFDSYLNHNSDKITLYISTPNSDADKFREYVKDKAIVISDESYASSHMVKDGYWGLSAGYVNQEICKLSFWETGYAKNYLCIDSDAYFIRDFYIKDFMANESTPYSVLVMDKELNSFAYYHEFGKWRSDHIKKIFEYVGVNDRRYLTCHGMTVLNSAVLEDMQKKLLKKNNKTYADLIEIAPYEYSWYNAWLQKSKIINIFAVEPFFKTFHMRDEYQWWRTEGVTEDMLARQYVGIILNSNWKPIGPPDRYENPGRVSKYLKHLVNRWG